MDMEKLFKHLAAKMDANQAKAEAERKTKKATMETNQAELLAKLDADSKAWQEEVAAMRQMGECQPQRDVGLPRHDGGTSRRREEADLTGQETGGGTESRRPCRKRHNDASWRTEEKA
jgi:hypothetical protein